MLYTDMLKLAETLTYEELQTNIHYSKNATMRAACEEILTRRNNFQK